MTKDVVIGFDLSLSAPAAVALPLDWRPGDWKRVRTWTIKPMAPANDDLRGQLERYDTIVDWAVGCTYEIQTSGDVFGYVEDYAFSKSITSTSRLRESGGAVKLALYQRCELVLTPVPASEARKRVLGFSPRKPANDPKVTVQRFCFDAGAPKTWSEDVCDAFIVAQYGLSELGGKILALPPTQKG